MISPTELLVRVQRHLQDTHLWSVFVCVCVCVCVDWLACLKQLCLGMVMWCWTVVSVRAIEHLFVCEWAEQDRGN